MINTRGRGVELKLFKGLCPGAGNAGSTFSWVPSQNAQNGHIWPKPRFSGPEPGFGPDEVIFDCFWKGLHQT